MNKTPQKDTVEFSNTQSNKLTFDKFMCMVDPFHAQQKIIGDYCKSILPESDPVAKEQVVQALGKLPFANKDYVQNNTNILS